MSTKVLGFRALAQAADDSGEPLYRVIAGVFRSRIRAGLYKPGEMLYSIRELVDELGVAKGTIVEAYGELERQGLVVKRRMSGHYVTTDTRIIASGASIDEEVSEFRTRLRARGFGDDEIDAAMKRSRRVAS